MIKIRITVMERASLRVTHSRKTPFPPHLCPNKNSHMQAIVQTGHGPQALTIRDIPVPQPQAGELLVKVSAISVLYANKLLRDGVFPSPAPFPAVMSGEVEGIVVAAGRGVNGFQPGQRVSGFSMQGFAEYAILPASRAYPLPEGFPVAQGLLSSGYTAQHLLAQAGGNVTSVIVTGAAGVIGSYLLQAAGRMGIKTIAAVTGNQSKSAYVTRLGATIAVSRDQNNWLDQLRDASPEGYSLLLDAGGGTTATRLLPLLAPGGTAVLYANMSGQPVEIDGNLMAFRMLRVVGATIYAADPADTLRWHEALVQDVMAGRLTVPFTAFAFEDFGEAFTALESRRTEGKIILQTA